MTDWRGRVHGASPAILAPASTEEVADIVRLAAEHRVPLVPQGGNTGMAAGATPPAGRFRAAAVAAADEPNPLDQRRKPAGRRRGRRDPRDPARAAHEVGMRFPLTLGARGSCTIGGLTSTNAGGTQVLKFGTMRALVAGVEAVLPDGSIHSGLSGLKKDNRGYSLDQLLIGAEGTLGVVTAVALRLVPAIASRAVAWAGVDSPGKALDAAALPRGAHQRRRRVRAGAADSLELVLRHIPDTRAPLVGHASRGMCWSRRRPPTAMHDIAAEIERLLAAALEQGMIADAVIAANEAQAEAFWKLRDSISEAERAEGQTLAHDISVPVADMPRFIVEAAAEVEREFPGVDRQRLRPPRRRQHPFPRPRRQPRRAGLVRAEGEEITRMVDDLVTAAGGSISAEHGIGQLKLAEFARLAPPGRIHALQAIKHALDPLGIMNPGKLVPEAGGNQNICFPSTAAVRAVPHG